MSIQLSRTPVKENVAIMIQIENELLHCRQTCAVLSYSTSDVPYFIRGVVSTRPCPHWPLALVSLGATLGILNPLVSGLHSHDWCWCLE